MVRELDPGRASAGEHAAAESRRGTTTFVGTQTMSRTGDCWDNAVAESFFATLKKELIHRYRWLERRGAAKHIGEYIELFYNSQRLHSSIGYQSPAEFEALNSNRRAARMLLENRPLFRGNSTSTLPPAKGHDVVSAIAIHLL